jgi:hypothetical protein
MSARTVEYTDFNNTITEDVERSSDTIQLINTDLKPYIGKVAVCRMDESNDHRTLIGMIDTWPSGHIVLVPDHRYPDEPLPPSTPASFRTILLSNRNGRPTPAIMRKVTSLLVMKDDQSSSIIWSMI